MTRNSRFSRRVCDETERNLRALRFIREPEIRVTGYRDGVVDLEVVTHDAWTMNPGISFSRSGGSAFGPTENLALLKNVGVGLRLGHSRSGLSNVIHLDVAFPLDGDRSIDRMQFLVQSKRSY